MKEQTPIGRFAPSPTGRMHLGNIYSALLSYLSVKSRGGQWLLRIEDIDPQRSRHAYAEQIFDDLLWLGLQWDGDVVWQSERSALYEQHLARLRDLQLVYPCFCTRADILATQAPHESDGRIVYPGTCRPSHLKPVETSCCSEANHSGATSLMKEPEGGRPAALRLFVPDEIIRFTDANYGPQAVNLAQHCGDFIVRRSDGAWAYQLAVVVDDALMGVNEVVRGADLLLSSAQQIYLYRLFGYAIPAFRHLPLLCNAAGQRLSKRDAALDISALRQQYTPHQLLGIIAHQAHLTPTPDAISLQDLLMLK